MLGQEESARLDLVVPLSGTRPRPARLLLPHGASRLPSDESAERRGAKAILHLRAVVAKSPQQRPFAGTHAGPRVPSPPARHRRRRPDRPDALDHRDAPSRAPRDRPAEALPCRSRRPGPRHTGRSRTEAVPAAAAPRPPAHRHQGPGPDTAGNRRVDSTSHRPSRPPASLPSPAPAHLSARGNRTASVSAAAAASDLPRRGYPPQDYPLLSPFRTRAPNRLQQLSAARLWNPTNSTPRAPATRPRRPSTPPPPSIPLSHPALAAPAADPTAAGAAGDHPLLSLPEQLQTRSGGARASPQFERSAAGDRVSLPRSVRHSYDEKRRSGFTPSPSPTAEPEAGPSHPRRPPPPPPSPREAEEHLQPRAAPFGLVRENPPGRDKGKGKAVAMASTATTTTAAGHDEDPGRGFSKDLERGPDDDEAAAPRHSLASLPGGIGSAISSSNSSIMGDPDQQAPDDDEWGPQHPCYPHLNPHVPLDAPEYATTRIIRIRRDWLAQGDLAPCFSNTYPEILDPAGLPEHEFRRVVEKINAELAPAFRPYAWRNALDGVLGVLTGWLWEDLGLTGTKARLRGLERWIEEWNAEMEKTAGAEEGVVPPKIVPLRRTAYMTLDIQISDPEILPSQSTPGASRGGASIASAEAPAEVTT